MAYFLIFSAVCIFVSIMARVFLLLGFGIEVQIFDPWWWGITFVSGTLALMVAEFFDNI